MAESNLSRPLIAWGVAWLVGGLAFALVPGGIGSAVGIAVCVGAAIVSWGVRSRSVRTGRERRVAVGWLALMCAAPLFVIIAGPAGVAGALIVAAAVWALGMMLFGIAASDLAVALAGALTLVSAAIARFVPGDGPVAVVGVVGGLTMIVAGLIRRRGRA